MCLCNGMPPPLSSPDSMCRRLQLLTCNLFGGAGVGQDMATVGRVFSNFFHHEVDRVLIC